MPSGPRPDPPFRSIKLVFNGHLSDRTWANVMWCHANGDGVITVSDLEALAGDAGDLFGTHFMPSLSNASLLETTQAVLWAEGGPFEGIVATPQAGGRTSPALPANCAAGISWKVMAHYRGGHPRTYLCTPTLDVMANASQYFSSYATELASKAAAFHAGLEELGPYGLGIDSLVHGVISFVDDGEWRTPPIFRPIVGQSVDRRLDTQRRRLGRDIA